MLIVTIAKRFTFMAVEGDCGSREYTVELEFTGPVQEEGSERGFVIDYQTIADAWAPLHEALDHRYLNEVRGLELPSTEMLAEWVIRRLVANPVFDRVCVFDRLVGSGVQLREVAPKGEQPPDPAERSWTEYRCVATLLSAVRVEESTTTWCRVTTDAVAHDRSGGADAPHVRKSLISLL